MNDKEKVIKGLECCIQCETQTAWGFVCTECPYIKDNHLETCTASLFRDTLELLKEQESVEPIATDSGVRIEYNCGSCGRWFCYKSKIHPEMDFRTRYCPHCGRKAKWDD